MTGSPTAFLLDVAGMDESKAGLARWQPSAAQRHPADMSLRSSSLSDGLGNPGRDSTTLTIVGIDLSTLATLRLPTYRVLARHARTGESHIAIFGKLKNLEEQRSPQHIVIDATGVGEGLWVLLDRLFPTRLIPVKFTARKNPRSAGVFSPSSKPAASWMLNPLRKFGCSIAVASARCSPAPENT